MLGARPEPGEYAMIDGDTIMSHGSIEAALRAAGAVVAGVDAVMGGKADTAFAAVRPPGHHADADIPAASASSTTSPSARAMPRRSTAWSASPILDFDVHHGQGTQAVVEPDADAVLRARRISIRSIPAPARARERGVDGNVVNVPLRARQRRRANSAPPGASASCRSSTASRPSC